MDILHFWKREKEQEPYAKTIFECKRGGLTIHGTEYRPEGENLPVAIVCHGFMAWQDTVRQYARELARMGYCAYCFDFCGGSVLNKGKSDGATTEMSVLTEVQDLEAVIGYVQGLPYNGSELLLMGCSQGGFVSALVAAMHPDLVNKLVLFYPALCIPDDARAGRMMFARFDPQNIPERINCGPMKLGRCYPADVMDMDPIAEIKPYRGPVLIVHGTKDSIVNPDYSRQAQRAYPNAKLHLIEGGAHGFSKKHDSVAIDRLYKFADHLDDFVMAHFYSIYNRVQLQKSNRCGCFYCKQVYEPSEIAEWTDKEEDTAICPYCGIDSVIGDACGYEINEDFLQKMNDYWFNVGE